MPNADIYTKETGNDDEEIKDWLPFILTGIHKHKIENVWQLWRKENGCFFKTFFKN